MSTPTRNYPAANIRVSDVDRDVVLAELSEHFQAGRLTSEELDERTGRALAARTGSDLTTITADLPAPQAARLPEDGRRGPVRLGFPLVLIVVVAAIIGLSATGRHGGASLGILIPIALLVARRMARRGPPRASAGED